MAQPSDSADEPDSQKPDTKNPGPAASMDDGNGNQAAKERGAVQERSSTSGCVLFTAVGASFLFFITFAFYSLFNINRELSQFCDREPRPAPLLNLDDLTGELEQLTARLNEFADASGQATTPVKLELSADDLNLAIAAFDEFKELQGTFFIEKIENGKLHIQISETLNGPPMSGEFYYLNGTLVAEPQLIDNEVILEIDRVEVPNREVPSGFLNSYSPRRLLDSYTEHPRIPSTMAALTKLEVIDGKIILSASKPAAPDYSKARPAMLRILIVVIFFTFILAGFVFLVVKRAKRS